MLLAQRWQHSNFLGVSSTHTGLEVHLVVLAVQPGVHPLAVVVVPAHEAVDLAPPVPVVESVAVLVPVAPAAEAPAQLAQLRE